MTKNTMQEQRTIERDKCFIFQELKAGKTLSQVSRQSGYSENAIRSWLGMPMQDADSAHVMRSVF